MKVAMQTSTLFAACAFVLGLVACDPPVPVIKLQLSDGPSQDCGTNACAQLAVDSACDMYVSVRVVKPTSRTEAFINVCEPLFNPSTANNLCGIRRVAFALPKTTLPYEDLELQVALFRGSDMVDVDGTLTCPTGTMYDEVNGFAIDGERMPVIAGRGYYHPGDDTIEVTLGCSDLTALTHASCTGMTSVHVTSAVREFDGLTNVVGPLADHLTLNVGEPVSQDPNFVLNPVGLTPLEKNVSSASWEGFSDAQFVSSICITVLDDTPQSTTVVTCTQDRVSITNDDYDVGSYRLTKMSLDRILSALNLTSFPDQGMTIGLVVDNGTPLGSQVVSSSAGTIKYLSSDRSAVVGSSTSAGTNGGVFVSLDAPYGTTFSSAHFSVTATEIGGRISGKVTIVVLDVGQQVMPGGGDT